MLSDRAKQGEDVAWVRYRAAVNAHLKTHAPATVTRGSLRVHIGRRVTTTLLSKAETFEGGRHA